jgi:hypothetical protein
VTTTDEAHPVSNSDYHRFLQGELYWRDFVFPEGVVRVEGTVGVDRQARTLLLWDVDIRPAVGQRIDIGAGAVRQIFARLSALAAADGFDTLVVSGYRVSGANPNRDLAATFDCRPFRAADRPLREAELEEYDMVAEKPVAPPREDLEPQITEARRMLAEGRTLEEVWRTLREAGLGMIDSKHVTVGATGMTTREAQRALYLSETWADMRPVIDELEDNIIRAALEMGATVKLDGRVITSWPPDGSN